MKKVNWEWDYPKMSVHQNIAVTISSIRTAKDQSSARFQWFR